MNGLEIGNISVRSIEGGRFWLDGGAMFGVIPRALWEPLCPTDDRNRIQMACNCLLIKNAGEYILIESGCGNRFNDKERDIFGITDSGSLSDNLRSEGVQADEISHVILTHLHFDHAAGALSTAEDGSVLPTFTNAFYWIQKREFEDAQARRSIMRTSYVVEDLQQLIDSGQTRFLNGNAEIMPGVRTRITGGHTANHQAVLIEDAGQTLVYPGDLIPTRAHLPPYWVMAYDMYPYDTIVRKREWIQTAVSREWIVAWDHDPDCRWSLLRRDGNHVVAETI